MGDCVHQRAIVRVLRQQYRLTLETSWPCIYHDMPDVRLIRRPVALRTQLKNAEREAAKFAPSPRPHHSGGGTRVHMTYSRGTVGDGTILKAMFAKAGIAHEYENADYTLPIPEEWHNNEYLAAIKTRLRDKPLLVYRPLVERPEWRGSIIRNANVNDYAAIFSALREDFFVVSVADLEEGREWIVGPRLKPDVELHKGELPFEALAALFSIAKLVYTSSGFGAVLAPAVRTPCISIQGGFEPSSWHTDGEKFAPYLGIDPIKPCNCSTSSCMNRCTKDVNVPAAIEQVRAFSAKLGFSLRSETRPFTEYHDEAVAAPQSSQGRRIIVRPGHMTQNQLLALRQARHSIKA